MPIQILIADDHTLVRAGLRRSTRAELVRYALDRGLLGEPGA